MDDAGRTVPAVPPDLVWAKTACSVIEELDPDVSGSFSYIGPANSVLHVASPDGGGSAVSRALYASPVPRPAHHPVRFASGSHKRIRLSNAYGQSVIMKFAENVIHAGCNVRRPARPRPPARQVPAPLTKPAPDAAGRARKRLQLPFALDQRGPRAPVPEGIQPQRPEHRHLGADVLPRTARVFARAAVGKPQLEIPRLCVYPPETAEQYLSRAVPVAEQPATEYEFSCTRGELRQNGPRADAHAARRAAEALSRKAPRRDGRRGRRYVSAGLRRRG